MKIRDAEMGDAKRLSEIYAPYVAKTAITFEWEAPSVEEFGRRIAHTKEKYPYLVAEDEDGRVVGYAYAGSFKEREAYDWAVELSIYMDSTLRGKGYGTRLYAELERRLKDAGFQNLNACITYCDTDSQYLTQGSVKFHTKLGYTKVAHFHKCGYKFGLWWDMIWMEKFVGDHPQKLEKPKGL